MNSGKTSAHLITLLLASMLPSTGLLHAADEATTTAMQSNSNYDEIAHLKAAIAEQQKQLQAMQQTLEKQQALLEKVLGSASEARSGSFSGVGEVASTIPFVPNAAPSLAIALPAPQPAQAPAAAAAGNNVAAVGTKVDNVVKGLNGYTIETRVFGL